MSSATAAGAPRDYIVGKTEPLSTKYEVGAVLGTGQYGLATHGVNKVTKQRVAIKTIDKTRFRATDIAYQYDAMASEIQIMRSIDHPNIIKLLDVFEDEKEIHIVMELCEGGELFDRYAQRPPQRCPWPIPNPSPSSAWQSLPTRPALTALSSPSPCFLPRATASRRSVSTARRRRRR